MSSNKGWRSDMSIEAAKQCPRLRVVDLQPIWWRLAIATAVGAFSLWAAAGWVLSEGYESLPVFVAFFSSVAVAATLLVPGWSWRQFATATGLALWVPLLLATDRGERDEAVVFSVLSFLLLITQLIVQRSLDRPAYRLGPASQWPPNALGIRTIFGFSTAVAFWMGVSRVLPANVREMLFEQWWFPASMSASLVLANGMSVLGRRSRLISAGVFAAVSGLSFEFSIAVAQWPIWRECLVVLFFCGLLDCVVCLMHEAVIVWSAAAVRSGRGAADRVADLG